MECPNCKRELIINSVAYRNLETSHLGGGQVLVSSECCKHGFLLKSRVIFSVTEYTGDKKVDDWGNEIINKK